MGFGRLKEMTNELNLLFSEPQTLTNLAKGLKTRDGKILP